MLGRGSLVNAGDGRTIAKKESVLSSLAHAVRRLNERARAPFNTSPIIMKNKITPCLWFDDQADEAGTEIHGRPAGSVMIVEFELDGQLFTALNGGPIFKFNEAISFQVMCETQDEVDYYWNKLSEGGPEDAQQCGWVKDKFGVSWQIVPTVLEEMMTAKDAKKSQRAMTALLKMKKLDIAELQKAFDGE